MIRLRKIEPTDVPFLYQWENDASVWSDGNNHNPLSQQDLRDYIASTTGDIYKDGQLRLIVEKCSAVSIQHSEFSGQHSETLGCVDLFDFDPRNRRAAIGMYIAPESRGKGVGSEALRLLEEYAFGHLNIRILYAVISTSNESCSALFRKADYQSTQAIPAWTLEAPAILWYKNNPKI